MSPFGCVAALIGGFSFIMSNIQVFNYKGSKVSFDFGNGVMTNATEMARVFNKEPYGWLRLSSTKEFLWTLLLEKYPQSVPQNLRNETPNLRDEKELSSILTSLGLVKIVQGGNSNLQGTWFNEDITIEFARWLAPAFSIWCNDRIKELLTGGHTIKELYDIIKKQQAQIKQLERRVKSLTSPRAKKERKRRLEVENADNWLASGRIAAITDGDNHWLPFDKIMENYLEFCKDTNTKRVGKNLLGKKLQRKFEHKKRRDTTWYAVIVVKE